MTKQEKIKQAWAEAMSGYTDFDSIGLSNHMFKHDEIDDKVFRTFPVLGGFYIIPRSLDGIGNNNGWIKIESEEDLPKDHWNYYLFCDDERIIDMKQYDYYRKDIVPNLKATHYQPIVKPKPPVY